MNKKDQEFQRELLATFKIEADEHLSAISSGLIDLEKTTTAKKRDAIIEAIYRDAHSLKGAARAVDLRDIEVICQSLESLFSGMKKKDVKPSPELFDTLHRSIDTITQLLTPRKEDEKAPDEKRVNELREQLARLDAGKPVTEIPGEEDITKPSKKVAPPPKEKNIM